MSLRRSLITNSYLYDLLLFVQPSTTTLSLFIPHEIPTKSETRDQSHPWPWGKGSLSLSLSIFSVGLQISFLCRLIKLAWHISDFYHLISPPCPSFSLFFFLPFCFILFYIIFIFPSLFSSSTVYVDSFRFFVPSILQFLSLRIYVSIRVGVCTCPSSLLRDCPRSRRNEHPFWDLSRPRRGYFTLSRGLGMNSNSFRVLVSLCSRCFEEEDRFFPWRTR